MSSISDIDGPAPVPLDTAAWLCPVLDRASAALLLWELDGRFPQQLRINPGVYDVVVALRRRELDAGTPLMLLGTNLVADPALPPDAFMLMP